MKLVFPGIADLIHISPLIALFLCSLIPITIKIFRGNKEQPAVATLIQGLIGIAISLALLLVFGGTGQTAFADNLIFDGLTYWSGFIALSAAALSLFLMYENPSTTGDQFSELTFLTLNSALGMLILTSATDLLIIFIGLELMSLSLYLMIGMSHEEKLSKEAAFKYFILGSFASAIFLYGTAFIFGTAKTTNILAIMEQSPDLMETHKLYLFGIVLIMLGYCFKVSLAPFHAWTPDVYQGAPTPISAYMATAIKCVSFTSFLRVVLTGSVISSVHLFDILQWIAVITMLVGNTAAIIQGNLKRMLAYSSIAHSGYILIGVIAAGVSQEPSFASTGVLYYLLSYSLMTLGAFAMVALMERSENEIVNIDDLAGFSKRHPILALCFTIFLLSLAGIPPTVGFFGKFYVFSSAIAEGLIWLTVWGVINSVISVYYYLRPIVVMYMKDGDSVVATHSLHATKGTIVATAILIIILGLTSGALFELVQNTL
ncbi:MAG: NADH-quinone oxidoreductase subunit N [Bdellovibrionota bacterium]